MSTESTEPTLSTVWDEIQRLIAVDAKHRSGFTMQDCDPTQTLLRAQAEFQELQDAHMGADPGDSAAAAAMEAGDTIAVLLYYAHCIGYTQQGLAKLMLKKFKQRFTEGAAPAQQRQVVVWQYYYHVDGCTSPDSTDEACICWHDEGTGPFATVSANGDDPHSGAILSWRTVTLVVAGQSTP